MSLTPGNPLHQQCLGYQSPLVGSVTTITTVDGPRGPASPFDAWQTTLTSRFLVHLEVPLHRLHQLPHENQ